MADSNSGYVQSGTGSPEQALQALMGEAHALTGPGGEAQGASLTSSGPDPFFDGIIAAAAPVTKVASLFISGAVSGVDGYGGSANKGSSSSQFVGGQKQRPEPTPLVPRSYGEMKDAAKKAAKMPISKAGNVWASVRLAGMSLTNGDTGGSAGPANKNGAFPKGVKVAANAVKKLTDLKQKIAVALHAREGVNRYDGEGATRRLPKDFKDGSPGAKQVAMTNFQNVKPPSFNGNFTA